MREEEEERGEGRVGGWERVEGSSDADCGEYSRLPLQFSPRVIVILRLLWCREFYPFLSFPVIYSFASRFDVLGNSECDS